MKKCSKCGQDKPFADYYVKDAKSGRLHAHCKLCYAQHRKTYYKKHYEKYHEAYLQRARKRRIQLRTIFRQNMLEYLTGKSCVICEESDIRTLEFAHLNPSEKTFSISQAVRLGYSWQDILLEIKNVVFYVQTVIKRKQPSNSAGINCSGGTERVRTAVRAFAELCLTTRPRRPKHRPIIAYSS